MWDLEGHLRTRPQPRAHLAAGATLPRPTSSAQHCAPLAVHICQCTPGCPPRAHANDNGHGRHKHASMPVAAMQGGRTATRYNAAARRSSTMPGCIRQMRCGVNVCGRAMRGVWQAQLRHEGMSRAPKGTRPLSKPKAPLKQPCMHACAPGLRGCWSRLLLTRPRAPAGLRGKRPCYKYTFEAPTAPVPPRPARIARPCPSSAPTADRGAT